MKADLSRNTFDRAQHFSAVRLQQGRIVTDADWNEQADIGRYHAEWQARDTIGLSGGPLDGAGYQIVAETNALAVQALNANVTWIVAEDGVLLETTNGGADWTLVDLECAEHLRAIATSGNAGWVVGDGGVVRKTNDAGLSWSSQQAGTVRTLRGVDAVDANRAWTVGDGGIIVSTSDGGVSWNLVQTEAARLYAVGFADALNGVAVGQGGVILRSSDGGDTWSGVASGSTDHLRALARVDATRLWVAGQGGTILRSVDGGATWRPCATPSSLTLHAIAFRDALEGWAVGEGGTVLHSIDAGATWQQEHSGLGAVTLRGLTIFPGEPGWVVGDGGEAFRVGISSLETADVPLPAVNLSIQPGRYYVNGMLCELEARCSYANQADGGAGERLVPGAHLLYLDVWQRHISAFEAPAIREVALGGPDTATRARTVAQVRALPLPAGSPFDWNCDSSIESWDALIHRPRPRLAARAEPQLAAANVCEISATAGYRRLENQLYRVEVHEGGPTPTFKWSRENGSVGYPVVSVTIDSIAQQTTVLIAARGRDANLDLAVHDRVELIDDEAELMHRAGTLFEYVADGNDELELVLAGIPADALGQDASQFPLLRRWDHKPTVTGANVLPIVEGTWINLEDGVQVRFEPGGAYRPGDYWQIPARTITADVEWPHDDDGYPVAREPAGIADSYCRLGIVEVGFDGMVRVIGDCRGFFPPLTELAMLHYLGGDAQEVTPDPGAPAALLPLHGPLRVGVCRGRHPVAGARVRFSVRVGAGRLSGGDNVNVVETGVDSVVVETGFDGTATVKWSLDSTTLNQSVEAAMESPGGEQPQPAITFTARLSRASEVSFDPAMCPPLAADRTVQAAIERLCQISSRSCATIVLSPDNEWASVLRDLKPEEDVHICFQRGVYRTTEVIELSDLGHVLLSGCGDGSRVFADGPECALHFSNCASLKVTDLALLAPRRSNPDAPIPDINGVLTATQCAVVEVWGCFLQTGGASRRDRSCLTIRQTREGRAPTVTRRVVVKNNRFVIGDGQIGVLVTDAHVVQIGDNELVGTDDEATVAGQGIVCAGNRLAEVSVSGNSMERMHEGIRVAVSHRAAPQTPPDMIGSVCIQGNHIELALPPAAMRGGQGVFIGNAERVYLCQNEILFETGNSERLFEVGAELAGHYGPLIHLRENTVLHAVFALRVSLAADAPNENAVLWRSVGNLLINGGEPGFLYRVDPDRSPNQQDLPFVQRDNRSIQI